MHRSFLLITGRGCPWRDMHYIWYGAKRDIPYIDFSDLDTIM